ncbi:MAG: hypothetical protein K6E50_11945 [Lachnospiraceae bacterium]|nr:hypothetical protein [Lachnospiraceae bacterium]
MNRKITETMYKADERSAEELEHRMGELAASFTPEWHFSVQDPDIGSTISRIFARQLADNIRSMNHVTGIYHAAFVNLLDLTLKRAVPAGSMVCFELVDNVVDGANVPRGTLVTTETGDAGKPVFETDRDLYVSSARITDIFMTDLEDGTIIPLRGDFATPELFEGEIPRRVRTDEEESGEQMPAYSGNEMKPFVLFGEEGSIGRHVLALNHPSVFDVDGEELRIRLEGNEDLNRLIKNGEMEFAWYDTDHWEAFSDMSVGSDGAFRLKMERGKGKDGDFVSSCTCVKLEARHPVTETITIKDIRIGSEGRARTADHVGDGTGELRAEEFALFGETLAPFAECYIGMDSYFNKPGARVSMRFHLRFEEHAIELSPEKEESELRIIKRKSRSVKDEVITEVFADEATIEYFNGIGWKQLRCEKEYRTLFAGEQPGDYELAFECPADWEVSSNGGYRGRLLRFRLLRTDNCYMRPAVHHYPVISGLDISYSYEGRELRPGSICSISGTKFRELKLESSHGEECPVFTPIPYSDDALYLGLDAPLASGPIGILFLLQGGLGQRGVQCCFEYSTRRGFQQIKVSDGTEDFTHSGIVMFLPPPDFAAATLEGRKRYWIRIRREAAQTEKDSRRCMVHVENILMNAVTVSNAIHVPEQDFYIDEVQPRYRVFLGAENILDAEVWVNERASLGREEMKSLQLEHPEDVILEKDIIGNIVSCMVRWHEVEQFDEWDGIESRNDAWDARRCYRIDRLTGEILFGDGVHTEMPRVTDDVAFRVRLRTCAGETGNVAAGLLDTMPVEPMFVDNVYNPVRAYGGSNMETVQEALLRGADRINSRNRCVSLSDYKRAILSYSSVIDKVSGVMGRTIDGREDPAELSLVLLMRDHGDGSFSFHRLEEPLRHYLLERCEITVVPSRLHIVEPIFAAVSVSVWLEVADMDNAFELQSSIREILERYLDPVNGGGESADGWEIGVMPKKTQILMQLAGIRKQALIRKTSITVNFTDHEGEHEVDYDALKAGPFMVCCSGRHTINILYKTGEEHA